MPGGDAATGCRRKINSEEHDILPMGTRHPEPSQRPTEIAPWSTGVRIAALVLGVGLAFAVGAAQAQDRPGSARPSALGAATVPGTTARLQIPAVIIGAPASETSLGISITQDGALPANSYVRIRGLNPQMALTAGHVIAPGAWAVPIAALSDLRLVIPAGAAGKSDVAIALVAIDGGVIAEARTSLVVAGAALGSLGSSSSVAQPPPTPPPPANRGEQAKADAPPAVAPQAAEKARPSAPAIAAVPPAPPPATSPPPTTGRASPAPPDLSPADRERAAGFLTRGRSLLQSGDIASARLFLRRAADAGLAEGALAMGDTFDPNELNRLKAVGVQPDPVEARQWYEKARTLGAGSAADRRLERLGGR